MGIPVAAASTPSTTPPAGDLANAVLTGTLTSATQSTIWSCYGAFNFAVWGTFTANLQLEKTYDSSTTWIPVAFNNNPTQVFVNAPASLTIGELERGVAYRLNCVSFTTGTINYRFSTSGTMAMSAFAQTV